MRTEINFDDDDDDDDETWIYIAHRHKISNALNTLYSAGSERMSSASV